MTFVEMFAGRFFDAFYERRWGGAREPHVSILSMEDSYRVQDAVAQMRIDKGERVAGYKVGCTSTAIRSQFGLQEPIHGRVFRPHVYEEGAELYWNDYANCAIEPEMVLTIGKDLRGESLSEAELIDGIAYVSPGIEVHNYTFWFQPTTVQELICSGGIHAGLVVGDERVPPGELSFRNESFAVLKDGETVTRAPAREIMGGPLNSLRWLVSFLTGNGSFLGKGSVVIPGSPVELVSIDRDTELRVDIEHVGALSTRFRERTERERRP